MKNGGLLCDSTGGLILDKIVGLVNDSKMGLVCESTSRFEDGIGFNIEDLFKTVEDEFAMVRDTLTEALDVPNDIILFVFFNIFDTPPKTDELSSEIFSIGSFSFDENMNLVGRMVGLVVLPLRWNDRLLGIASVVVGWNDRSLGSASVKVDWNDLLLGSASVEESWNDWFLDSCSV